MPCRRAPLAALLCCALAAGCAQPGDPAPPPAAPGAPLPSEADPWHATDCRRAVVVLERDGATADEDVPERHRNGEATQSLTLTASECGSLNGTGRFVAGFRFLTLHQRLYSNSAHTDAYLFEVVASDAGAVEALRAAGFPAVLGDVRVVPAGRDLRIEAFGEAFSYTFQGVGGDGGPLDNANAFEFRLERDLPSGTGWMGVDVHPQSDTGLAYAGVVQASGGYLSRALHGASLPGRGDLSGGSQDLWVRLPPPHEASGPFGQG